MSKESKPTGNFLCSECDTAYDDYRAGCPRCTPPQPKEVAAEDDPFIQKHLAIIRDKTMDALIVNHIERMWGGLEMASVQHFVETGKVNGSFHQRLKEILTIAYKWQSQQPAKPAPEERISAEDRDNLIRIRTYFGSNDKTTFEHFAYGAINVILKKLPHPPLK